MDLEKATYKISLSHDEAMAIGFAVHHTLRTQVDSHYNRLQQEKDGEPLFLEQEHRLLELMKFLFEITGRGDIYEDYIREFKSLFETKRRERKEIADD